MFKTSQPTPERSKNDRIAFEPESTGNSFETLIEFSNWLDEQLLKLESGHEGFTTSQSIRSFFKRN
jgi:hypothetical protein